MQGPMLAASDNEMTAAAADDVRRPDRIASITRRDWPKAVNIQGRWYKPPSWIASRRQCEARPYKRAPSLDLKSWAARAKPPSEPSIKCTCLLCSRLNTRQVIKAVSVT